LSLRILGPWAVAAGVALWCLLVASLLASRTWLFDLLANLRIQYAVCLVLLALLALALRWWAFAAFAALGALVAAVGPLRYSYFDRSSTPADTSRHFRVVQLNAWFRNHDVGTVARFLERARADIAVIEEWDPVTLGLLARALPSYRYSYVDADLSRHGAAVFSRWPILQATTERLAGADGSAAVVGVSWEGTAISVIGAHVHWPLGAAVAALRDAELAQLAELARKRHGPLMLVGDFNLTPWSAAFERLIADSGLADPARGRGLIATWPTQFPLLGMRIDHCFVSPEWRALDVRRAASIGSDHFPVVYDLALAVNALERRAE
jgi:endonuclease/exonuclease/phosphatase (EEP) superfamily protein YafD